MKGCHIRTLITSAFTKQTEQPTRFAFNFAQCSTELTFRLSVKVFLQMFYNESK